MNEKMLLVIEGPNIGYYIGLISKMRNSAHPELRVCLICNGGEKISADLIADLHYVVKPNDLNFGEYITQVGECINVALEMFRPDSVRICGEPLFCLAVAIPSYFGGYPIESGGRSIMIGSDASRFPEDMAEKMLSQMMGGVAGIPSLDSTRLN